MFISFNPDIDTKEKALEIAGRWVSMLQNGHIELKPYPIEDNRFIFIVDDGAKVAEVLKVLREQKEFNYAEIDQQKHFGKYSYLKLHPEALKAEENRIESRDSHLRDRQKWPKVVEKRNKHKPGTKKNKPQSDEEQKKKKRKKKRKKVKKPKKSKGMKTKTKKGRSRADSDL